MMISRICYTNLICPLLHGLLPLGVSKVPDARRQGVTSKVYNSYSAARSDRRQRSRRYLDGDLGNRMK